MDRTSTVALSDAQMIRYRDDRRTLSFTLQSGATIRGQVLWFDDKAYHVSSDSGELTLMRHAVFYYQSE